MTKKKPQFGALPTLNMPEKSPEMTKPTPRPGRSVVKDYEQLSSSSVYYKTFNELCQRVKGLKTINNWNHKLFGGEGGWQENTFSNLGVLLKKNSSILALSNTNA